MLDEKISPQTEDTTFYETTDESHRKRLIFIKYTARHIPKQSREDNRSPDWGWKTQSFFSLFTQITFWKRDRLYELTRDFTFPKVVTYRSPSLPSCLFFEVWEIPTISFGYSWTSTFGFIKETPKFFDGVIQNNDVLSIKFPRKMDKVGLNTLISSKERNDWYSQKKESQNSLQGYSRTLHLGESHMVFVVVKGKRERAEILKDENVLLDDLRRRWKGQRGDKES